VPLWVLANLLLDIPLRRIQVNTLDSFRDNQPTGSFRLVRNLPPMKLGNWRFALYLLILSGFWTSFTQIFITMPEYIRDFVNSSDMLTSVGGFFSLISPIKVDYIARLLDNALPNIGAMLTSSQLSDLTHTLLSARVRLEPSQIENIIRNTIVLGQSVTPGQLSSMAQELIRQGHQVNPEYLVKFDAGSIVCFQLLVSYIISRWKPFSSMIGGMVVASVGLTLAAFAHSGWAVVGSIVVFSFGEMMASPKATEYIGRIAPENKKALYMGYAYWATALGNLFGGLLSGQLYGHFARDLRRPDLMWIIFGALSLFSAGALVAYDRLVIRKLKAGEGMAG
jgi:POT family proton-dependent oligopeptide transporter